MTLSKKCKTLKKSIYTHINVTHTLNKFLWVTIRKMFLSLNINMTFLHIKKKWSLLPSSKSWINLNFVLHNLCQIFIWIHWSLIPSGAPNLFKGKPTPWIISDHPLKQVLKLLRASQAPMHFLMNIPKLSRVAHEQLEEVYSSNLNILQVREDPKPQNKQSDSSWVHISRLKCLAISWFYLRSPVIQSSQSPHIGITFHSWAIEICNFKLVILGKEQIFTL